MRNNDKLGEVAMELIADYPLYASTSNITYDEAIAVAKIFFGDDLERAVKEKVEDEKLMKEYFDTHPENPTLEGYEQWVAKKKGEN